MDPLLVTAVVGGATGAFVKGMCERGVEWLIDIVGAHSSEVQKAAHANAVRFHLGTGNFLAPAARPRHHQAALAAAKAGFLIGRRETGGANAYRFALSVRRRIETWVTSRF